MSSKLKLPAYSVLGIMALGLIGAMTTCVDHKTPTSSSDQSIADFPATASLVSGTISHTVLTSGNNAVNQRIYTTASISPAPNALITVAVLGRQSTGVGPSPVLSGGGMTAWTEVATVTFDPLGVPTRRLTIFRAMSATPGSGPLTITWSGTSLGNCQWVVSQWDGVDQSGLNGVGAIGQTGTNRGDAVSGLTVALGALGNAANVAYGAFGVTSTTAVVTPGAGFTEIAELPSGESTPGDLEAEWATNDNTIDAGWGTSKNGAALGIEIKAAGTGGGPQVSASLSTVDATPTPIVAGSGSSTITVTVKDASGNPISGATVAISATGTGNTVTQPAGPTDNTGVTTGTLSSTVAESKTVSASANGTAITQTATVTVAPGPVSASQSTVTADPTSIGPGGTSTITVRALDANGNPISDATVVLAATGSGSALTQPASTTNASGVATGTVSSTLEETVVVSATIAGVPVSQTATVMVMMHAPATIAHTLLTAGNDVVNKRVYTTASIAPAPNALITVAVLGRQSSGASPSPILSGGGMTTWTEVATATFDPLSLPTRRVTIYRAMSATPGSGPLTITFAGTQGNSQWIVSQWTGVDQSGANGVGAIGLTGTNRGDAVSGLTVTLGALGSAGNVAFGAFGVTSKVAVVTPGAGFAEIAELPSGESTPGDLAAEWATNDNTIDAGWGSAKNGAALGLEIRAGEGGPGMAVVSVDVTPASADLLVGGTVQLTATPRNAEGEPLSGRVVTWESDAPTVATVSATGLVTGVGDGAATITATSEGESGTASVTVTTNVEPVASVEVVPTSATVSVGGIVQLTATAKDAAGQPLTGRSFTWATDASGVAKVSGAGLVTGVGVGAATITATSEGKSGSAGVTVTSGGQAAQVGQWSALFPAPLILIHVHLMLDGRVLIFGRTGVQVWDPASGAFAAAPSPSLLFCSGHNFLPDGRLLVSGGGEGDGLGLRNTNIFDPASAAWTAGPSMAQGRWYPTNTILPNGELLTIAGQDDAGIAVPVPEVWDGTSWRQLTTASMTLPNYPRMFVAPDGRLYYAGGGQQTRYLDVSGTGAWTDGPLRKGGGRSYGPAIMYEPGKILYVGGGNPPTNTAEIIDLNQPNPQWAFTGSLAYARSYHNGTVLPTGEVLVTSGTSGDRSNPALAINAAEIWNPTTGSWTTLPSAAPLLRGYHSTSLLLPDGRVLHGGGGGGGGTVDNYNYEVYSPAYLFKGARPVVNGTTPTTVGYGQTLTVGTPDGASVTKVVFIRFGSVTHAFDQSQLLVPLGFSQVAGGLSVTLPTSRTVAPPGPYMLFLVNGNGVPSVARLMRLQ